MFKRKKVAVNSHVNSRSYRTILTQLKKSRDASNEVLIPKTPVEAERFTAAMQQIDAEEYIEGYVQSGGKYIAERLRDGFIGETVYIPGGASYIQTQRGKPFGTCVAIPTKDGEVVIGVSYISPEENEMYSSPAIGLAYAIKNAVERLARKENGFDNKRAKSRAKKQLVHFEKRAKAYFNPEKYSHSRGTNPVVYEDYDEIHERQKAILGSEKTAPLNERIAKDRKNKKSK